MKPTSPFLLYIFLSLTSAAPVISVRECSTNGSCGSALRDISIRKILSAFHLKHTVTTSKPHFPEHQLTFEEDISISDSVTISPSHALDAELPLESSFLLELAKSKDNKIDDSVEDEGSSEKEDSTRSKPMPSAPTSALPELRAEEARKLELSLLHPSRINKGSKCHKHAQVSVEMLEQEKDLTYLRNKLQRTLLNSGSLEVTPREVQGYFTKLESIFPTLSTSAIRDSKINRVLEKIATKKQVPYDEEYRFKERARTLLSTYVRMVGVQSRKEAVHGDVLVVGIVALFVIAVVIVEAADMAISSLKFLFGIQSKGAIRLPDDNEAVQGLKSFQLLPAPKGRKAVVLEKIVEEV